ncbi:MAG: GH3 auxin-responsive promoter family protein [Nanoarchaeota archaeon]|nr:GH3 auxin-responsive promoter family protein [Nanoarchaeota archaeon]
MDYKELGLKFRESCRDEHDLFRRSLSNVESVQSKKLIDIVSRNSSSVIGNKYEFSDIKSVDEFRSRVPVSTYEDYGDYIGRISKGEKRVLTTEDVLMLEPTSGSTSASKLIPYTESLRGEFHAGIFPWLYDLMDNVSGLIDGSFYWSITPAANRNSVSEGEIPIGFGDDSTYFSNEQIGYVLGLSPVPHSVSGILDMEEFRFSTLGHLLGNEELSFISIWNPTFLPLLFRPLEENPKEAIQRVGDRKRRDWLENLFKKDLSSSERYSEIWPNVSLISCWASGNSKNYVPEIQKMFPDVLIQGKGLLATEGFVTLPIIGEDGCALSINSHFFEFRDIETRNLSLAHEVTEGKQYEVIMTTGSGLYRYNLGDIVRVNGFLEECPLLEFEGRGNMVSDLFGEKLNERHVADSIRSSLDGIGIDASFFMISPEDLDDKTSYTLFIEGNAKLEELSLLRESLEKRLKDNFHYNYCRNFGQLGSLEIFQIEEGNATDIYLGEKMREGKKLGDIKPSALDSGRNWSSKFYGSFIK